MDSKRDLDNSRNNSMYYNQLLHESKARSSAHERHSDVPTSFTSKNVDISEYVLVPDGYEGIFYLLYLIAIPYVMGAIFLFIFIAGGNFAHFKLLDLNSFLIVWMIGYEIVATLVLIAIFISFLRYENKPKSTKPY